MTTNNSFGPWTPRVRLSSMSAVLLGPVMKVIQLVMSSMFSSLLFKITKRSPIFLTKFSGLTIAKCIGGRSETLRGWFLSVSKTNVPVSAIA